MLSSDSACGAGAASNLGRGLVATTVGIVRLLETEPTKEERYAHALALLALATAKQDASSATAKPT